jgi:hypothetical protein
MHTALPEGRSGRKASPEDQRETSLTDERGGANRLGKRTPQQLWLQFQPSARLDPSKGAVLPMLAGAWYWHFRAISPIFRKTQTDLRRLYEVSEISISSNGDRSVRHGVLLHRRSEQGDGQKTAANSGWRGSHAQASTDSQNGVCSGFRRKRSGGGRGRSHATPSARIGIRQARTLRTGLQSGGKIFIDSSLLLIA